MEGELKAKKIAYWGLLGIIPFIGGIAGIVLLILGIIYKNRRLIVVGAIDMLLAIVFWAIFFTYFIHWMFHHAGISDLEKQVTRKELNSTFKDIEFYKLKHGDYPASLREVEGFEDSRLYYEKTGDKYWLFSVGPDEKPFTADDVYPEIDPGDSAKFGLRMR